MTAASAAGMRNGESAPSRSPAVRMHLLPRGGSPRFRAGVGILLAGAILQTAVALLVFTAWIMHSWLPLQAEAFAVPRFHGPASLLGVAALLGYGARHGFAAVLEARAGRARLAGAQGLVASLLPPIQPFSLAGGLLCITSPEGRLHSAGAGRLGRISVGRFLRGLAGRDLLAIAAYSSLLVVGTLLYLMFREGVSAIDWQFLTSFTSRFPEKAGIKAAIVGTAWLGVASMVVAIPIGIMAAIYLNEFAKPGRVTSMLRASISNLAGVPSVVFGLLGLALFVRALQMGVSIQAAGFTLGLLTMPIVIVVSEEALKAVPRSMREAAFALGASRWQVVRHHVLPYGLPGMLTGAILALSRTLGETAPLVMIGVAVFIDFLPEGPGDQFAALPTQAYNWALHAKAEFHTLAWGTVLVLIAMVLIGNLTAILLRDRFQRRFRW